MNGIPERVAKLEQQMSEAHRKLINALQETQVERFNRVDERLDKVEDEMREGFSKLGVGMAQITALLTIEQEKSD